MNVKSAAVRPDGTSALLPAGVYDMAALQQELSPELEAKVNAAVAKLDPRETKAQFKLEVFFKGGPSRKGPVRGVVSFWTNGGYLHGGGDAAIYLCPQYGDNGEPCAGLIDAQFILPKQAVCPKCRRASKAIDLVGQLVIENTTQRWARLFVKFFHILECNADVSISIERESMQKAALEEREKPRGGEGYARVLAKRECITYSLANIIKDTASGAGLEERFRAFLEA